MARTETAKNEEAKTETPAVGGKKMVKIKLFRDNGRYKDAVYAAVNGESYMIPRGVEVEVPDYIAEVVENSIRQDEKTANQMEHLEAQYDQKTAAQK